MILPSKELLSDVLEEEVIEVLSNNGGLITFNKMVSKSIAHKFGVDIYKLMHLMKEWALHNQTIPHMLQSFIHTDYSQGGCKVSNKNLAEKIFYADTEPEAVIKACEWIRKQKDKK